MEPYSKRAAFYSEVTTAFTQGGDVQHAAEALSGAKLLLDAYIAMALPRSLEEDDFIRYLLYGGQQNAQTLFWGGPDPNNPTNQSSVQNLYVNAIPQPPELDITPITDERINALETALTARLGQMTQGQFIEGQRLLNKTLGSCRRL